jgi:hypothetical protein
MPGDRRLLDTERRQSRRVAAVFAVRNDANQRGQLGQAEDIGPTGMTLRWPKDAAFLPLAPVALTFELPGSGQPIAARALVVNQRGTGRFSRTGVRFTSLAPEHAALIRTYCERKSA